MRHMLPFVSCHLLISLGACVGDGRPPVYEVVEMIEVTETETQFALWFARDGQSASGIDMGNECFTVIYPGLKGSPSIYAGKAITYDGERRTLRFEWEQSDGRRELVWSNVDAASWVRLREFARTHVRKQVKIQEE